MPLGLSEFLIQTILDVDFRNLALSDPDRAFEGFELTDDERDVLRSGDARLLGLLTRTLQDSWDEPIESAKPSSAPRPEPRPAPAVQSLPEVRLLLRLVPQAIESDAGVQINYAASLHPVTDDGPAPAPSDDAAVDMMIQIVPTVVAQPGTQPRVAYAATIQPPGASLSPPTPASSNPTLVRYHTDSAAAKRAAEAVRTAPSQQRQTRLLELIDALRHGDR